MYSRDFLLVGGVYLFWYFLCFPSSSLPLRLNVFCAKVSCSNKKKDLSVWRKGHQDYSSSFCSNGEVECNIGAAVALSGPGPHYSRGMTYLPYHKLPYCPKLFRSTGQIQKETRGLNPPIRIEQPSFRSGEAETVQSCNELYFAIMFVADYHICNRCAAAAGHQRDCLSHHCHSANPTDLNPFLLWSAASSRRGTTNVQRGRRQLLISLQSEFSNPVGKKKWAAGCEKNTTSLAVLICGGRFSNCPASLWSQALGYAVKHQSWAL